MGPFPSQCKAKLLCKPPYRFVHDVVSAIQKETGFGAGLFDETESDSKCKDPKVKSSFLQKVIDLVGISLGEVVDVRVKKIMSGQEPECTNMLLQKLVQAATDDRVDRESAVNRVLDGEHQGEGRAARSAGADDGGGGAEEKGDADRPPTFEDEGKTLDDADAEEQKDAGDALPPSASVDPSQFTESESELARCQPRPSGSLLFSHSLAASATLRLGRHQCRDGQAD